MNIHSIPVLCALLAVSTLVASVPVLAQEAATTPRQLHEQLGALVAAGYRPVGNDIDYPSNLATAQTRVAASQAPATTGYGPNPQSATQAGAHAVVR